MTLAITTPRAAAASPGRWLLPVILLGNVLNVIDVPGTLSFGVADSHGFGTATVTAELTEAALAVVTAALAWTLPSARR